MSAFCNLTEEEYKKSYTSLPALKIAVRQMHEVHKLMDGELRKLLTLVNAYEQENYRAKRT